jgi:uncharacterized membrane protein
MDRFIRVIFLSFLMVLFEELSDQAYEKGQTWSGISLFAIVLFFGYLLLSRAYQDGKKDAEKKSRW